MGKARADCGHGVPDRGAGATRSPPSQPANAHVSRRHMRHNGARPPPAREPGTSVGARRGRLLRRTSRRGSCPFARLVCAHSRATRPSAAGRKRIAWCEWSGGAWTAADYRAGGRHGAAPATRCTATQRLACRYSRTAALSSCRVGAPPACARSAIAAATTRSMHSPSVGASKGPSCRSRSAMPARRKVRISSPVVSSASSSSAQVVCMAMPSPFAVASAAGAAEDAADGSRAVQDASPHSGRTKVRASQRGMEARNGSAHDPP